MKSKICQNFVPALLYYYMKIEARMIFTSIIQRIHVVLYPIIHACIIFLNEKNCIINRKLFVNFPPNCLWKTFCFSSISFIQVSFILKRLLMVKNAKLSEMIKLIAGFYIILHFPLIRIIKCESNNILLIINHFRRWFEIEIFLLSTNPYCNLFTKCCHLKLVTNVYAHSAWNLWTFEKLLTTWYIYAPVLLENSQFMKLINCT